MDRQQVLQAIGERVKNPNLVKHMLATEAVMRALAKRLGEDEEEWGLAGLIHDIDVEIAPDFAQHSRMGAEISRDLGCSPAIVHAVLSHNEVHGEPLSTPLDRALFCADPLTGLVVAAALVLPDKKLASLKVESLVKRYGEKRFAAGAKREQIARCSELGLSLEDFLALGLEAMQGIAGELGL